ncbi:1-deoxy-D-xylulose-5-phosphate synthase [Halofilum ochraceum]|uniref:1-deoxy-D-xylulose-5-phosphate synthase n=1 Tax=Halofilum ochraceum TaxID=1611323 RepID=UPI00082A61DB|nr:1-deoxy-D-xylulose-5-phosphate synthase [Halofilum ochraceum]
MAEPSRYPLLDGLRSTADLHEMDIETLQRLNDEVRAFHIESVAATGGHLAAGLGAVELTTALHAVYRTPEDRLVWDVGHQTYPHKILTGRRERMDTMRMWGGLCGFTSRAESEYDTFGVGHSSTSISAATGMAIAAKLRGDDRRVVAIIGDGAMTAGMAFEALNHAGDVGANLLVILNDNDMSISPNVGALNKYLTRLLSGKLYSQAREGGKKVLRAMPPMWELARRTEEHFKGMVVPGTMFEEFGFNYYGPVDGHDLPNLVKTLGNLRDLEGPRLLHIVTEKGKGYKLAEDNPVTYHGVKPFDPATGKKLAGSSGPSGPAYTEVFGQWLCDMAARDERVVGITPAMREGSGLVEFEQQFPQRYFDVGIAEQHAVTLAAGLACEGQKPVVAIYSTFLQRGYDQLVHDVAVQGLPVLFALDRAGFVGEDGPTHFGSFDFAYMRCLPGMTVMAPADENECRQMLYTGLQLDGPASVRYPKGPGPGAAIEETMQALEIGRAEKRRSGQRIALLAFGSMVAPAAEVAEALDASLYNMRFVKPLDEAAVLEAAEHHDVLVTLEEAAVPGGAGEAINSCLTAHRVRVDVHNIGIPDRFVGHGSRGDQLRDAGLDAASLQARIEALPAPLAGDRQRQA